MILARPGTGRLLRRAVTVRRAYPWLLAGTITPVLVAAVAVGSLWAIGSVEPEPWPLLPMLLGFALFFLPAAFEELGWAFATDALLPRWGWAATGWALGTIAAAWRLVPLLQAGNSWTWIAAWFASSAAGRVAKVWFYLKTERAVPVLIGIHAMDNACAAFVPGYNVFPGIVAGAVVVVALAVMLTVAGRRALPVMDGLSTGRCDLRRQPG